jgi:biotin transport system substrate-specific component
LISYPAAAFATGWLVERAPQIARWTEKNLRIAEFPLVAALIAGEVIIFAGGCAWLALGIGLGWQTALRQGALPFLPGEIIKMALIVIAIEGFNFSRRNSQRESV